MFKVTFIHNAFAQLEHRSTIGIWYWINLRVYFFACYESIHRHTLCLKHGLYFCLSHLMIPFSFRSPLGKTTTAYFYSLPWLNCCPSGCHLLTQICQLCMWTKSAKSSSMCASSSSASKGKPTLEKTLNVKEEFFRLLLLLLFIVINHSMYLAGMHC